MKSLNPFNLFRAAADPETEKGAAPQRDPQEFTHMLNTNIAPMGQAQPFIREGVQTFTPAQAGFVLREHGYDKNRDISRSPKHIAVLAETMRRGLWLPKDQLAFANLNGTLVLVNGHHRMAAQVQSGVNIEWSVAIYPCANDAEVAALYARFDTNMKKRSDENIISALGLAEGSDLKSQTARALWRAVPIIANGMTVGRGSQDDNFLIRHITDDRLELARNYIPEAREFQKAIANAPNKVKQKLLSGSIMAVGLVTMRGHLSTAYRFWEGLAENDGLRRGDPRATLIMWMAENNQRGLGAGVFAAAKAWNYYVEGKNLQIIKIAGNPIRIAGTQYMVAP